MFIGSVRLTDNNPEILVRVCSHEMIVYTDESSGEILHAHNHHRCDDEWRKLNERRAVFTFDHLEENNADH